MKKHMKDFEGGFSICGKGENRITTVEWLLDEKESNNNKLVFLAYDANLCGLPLFEKWKNNKHKQLQIKEVLNATNDFDGEVWLDGVRIK